MKYAMLIFFAICTFSVVQAQRGWAIGDRAAFGHSWVVGARPDNAEYKFHPTFQVGRQAIFNFNENIGLGFGTYFSSEGVRYEEDDNEDIKLDSRLNYARIPIIANFTFGDANSRVRPRISIGPSVGFLIGGKSMLIDDEEDAFSGIRSTKAMNTKIDAGANASIGLNIRLMDGVWLNHDINYYHGLVEQKPNNASETPSFTNRSLSMSMGFLINCQEMKKWKGKMMKHNRRW